MERAIIGKTINRLYLYRYEKFVKEADTIDMSP